MTGPSAPLERALTAALGNALGRELHFEGLRPIGGGCISEAARLDTDAGSFFAKWNAQVSADFFECEASGLRAMAAGGSSLSIPKVWCASRPQAGIPGFIVMDYLEPAQRPTPGAEELLGRGLAELHRTSRATFGFTCATYCGATRQANEPYSSWVSFYAERRLLPLLAAIGQTHALGATERRLYDRLLERLPELLSTDATPALIHGDLWSGNVLFTTRGPALVDPACAFAEREMEFGITTLFGGLTPRAWSAYQETFALRPGWRERNPLYQLYHLLNHYLLFGGGYGAQALQIARQFAE